MDAVAAWLAHNGGSVGFAGLVSLAIWLIFTGRLVPKSAVDARLDREREISQDLRQANLKLLDVQAVKDRQIDELLEHSRTTAAAFQALAKAKEAP